MTTTTRNATVVKEKNTLHTVLLIASMFLGYTMIYIDKLSIGISLVPMSEELGITPSQKGMIMSAFFLGYAIMQVPVGFLNAKLGSKKILIFSVFALGLFAALFSFGTSVIYFMLIRFLSGAIAHSGYAQSASKEVQSSVPVSQRTFAQGILISSSGIASVLGPKLVSPAVQNLGYKQTYLILTIIAILISLILIAVIPNNKTAAVANTAKKAAEKVSLGKILANRTVWFLFICDLLVNSVMYGVINWTPSFLTSDKVGFSLIQQGNMTSFIGIFFLVGSLGGSYIIGKFFADKERDAITIFAIIGSIALFLAYQIPHGGAINMWPITLCLAIGDLCYSAGFVILMSLPLKRFKPAEFAPSYACVATGGILGGFIAPYLIGFLVEKTGSYASVFTFFLVTGLLFALAIRFVPKDYTPIDEEPAMTELEELSQQEL
ncbi:MFS transporter [Lactococcus hodotermopsidis]|uniref:MFS transporter n=1 Tax=Pseudolactococcus hodotermopsidis TaxID=2709157 RepID=A0A6A0BB11_9LACT|nr:MFS transporter [Lactococcus hodotermopsidis]GFH41865.1 MFS transporter [Lactococcus hodotermopsidis]